MALTDFPASDFQIPPSNAPGEAFDPGAAEISLPFEALARLPGLHDEAGRNLRLTLLLARIPAATGLMLLTGSLLLLTAALCGGGTLRTDFAWTVLVLIGIVAMTRNYIRGFARSLRRVPLDEAVSDLRVLLLYMGAVWGSGAFLVLPGQPMLPLAVVFALAPALTVAATLRDRGCTLAFGGPVSVAVAGAALLGAWPLDLWVACAVLMGAAGLVLWPFAGKLPDFLSR